MPARSAALALAALAVALAATGCGKTCGDQTPPVSQSQTSPSCAAAQGASVTVAIHVCPKCDQAMPTCLVRGDAGAGRFTLEPVSEVCDPSSSCPIVDTSTPTSCPFSTLNCQLTAPVAGSYFIDVVAPDGTKTMPFTVSGPGAANATCTL